MHNETFVDVIQVSEPGTGVVTGNYLNDKIGQFIQEKMAITKEKTGQEPWISSCSHSVMDSCGVCVSIILTLSVEQACKGV